MDAIFYTVRSINGDYADLVTDEGGEHSVTMDHPGQPPEAGGFPVGAGLG